MDDQISRTILDNFDVAGVESGQNDLSKINAPGVLRGIEAGSLHFITVPSREQEFIDHSFLSPEYIATHITNGFIIDFMNNQDGNDQHQQSHFIGEPIANDLEFQSDDQERKLATILQLVNKQCPIVKNCNEAQVIVSNKELGTITPANDTGKQASLDHNFLTIDDQQTFPQNLLNDNHLKLYSQPQPQLNVNPPLPPLTPIRRLNSPRKITNVNTPNPSKNDFNTENISSFKTNQETTVTHMETKLQRPLAKKSLPHKKRITKKLETIGKQNQQIHQGAAYIDEPEDTVEEESIVLNSQQFSCQICGTVCESQLFFFAHLKEHYEPASLNVSKDDSSTVIESKKMEEDSLVSQDLQEVELQFSNFDDDILSQTKPESNAGIKDEKIGQVADNNNELPVKDVCDINVHEVEFSDTEDMLEGIRGVVAKVQESVDNDSNDGMDIISERAWYTNSALNGDINFKTGISSNNISQQSVDNFSLFFKNDLEKSTDQEQYEQDVSFSDPDKSNYNLSDKEKCEKTKSKHTRRARKNNKEKSTLEDEESSDPENSSKLNKKVQCPKCSKLFNSVNALKYHDLSHTGQRPHQCDVCGKGFYASNALKVHMRLHSGDKPYECEICKRAFRQWGDLKYHTISIHTNVKNFQCEFCGKAFARRYSLVVHRRIHTSERNYKCEFCPKSFRASTYLQNHRKVHTGEKPYACKYCDKKFRVSGDLKRHTNTHLRKNKQIKVKIPEEDQQILQQHQMKSTENGENVKLEPVQQSNNSGGGEPPIFYSDETLDLFKSEQFEQDLDEGL